MKKPPYIIYVNRLRLYPDWVEGTAIYPFIFIKNKDGRSEDELRTMIEHEKIHIKQQAKGWLVGFYIMYLYYSARYGYKKNPYEVEAYKHQDDWKEE